MQAGIRLCALKALRNQVKKSLNGCFYRIIGEKNIIVWYAWSLSRWEQVRMRGLQATIA